MRFERTKIDAHGMPLIVRVKWNARVLDEGFVPYAKRLLRCARFLFVGERRMTEHAAMMAIIDYQRDRSVRLPSLAYLAFTSGMSRQRFRKCLQAFVDRGWIVWRGDDEGLKLDYSGFLKAIMDKTDELDEKAKKKRRERDQ